MHKVVEIDRREVVNTERKLKDYAIAWTIGFN